MWLRGPCCVRAAAAQSLQLATLYRHSWATNPFCLSSAGIVSLRKSDCNLGTLTCASGGTAVKPVRNRDSHLRQRSAGSMLAKLPSAELEPRTNFCCCTHARK